jgi:hypothetical protein
MANVIATQRGYFGRVLREPGDAFVVPDEIMADDKLRPSWVRLAKAADLAATDGPADKPAKAKPGPKPKAETVTAPVAAPFSDAPAPETVRVTNEINEATGATQPDWLAPGTDI